MTAKEARSIWGMPILSGTAVAAEVPWVRVWDIRGFRRFINLLLEEEPVILRRYSELSNQGGSASSAMRTLELANFEKFSTIPSLHTLMHV